MKGWTASRGIIADAVGLSWADSWLGGLRARVEDVRYGGGLCECCCSNVRELFVSLLQGEGCVSRVGGARMLGCSHDAWTSFVYMAFAVHDVLPRADDLSGVGLLAYLLTS